MIKEKYISPTTICHEVAPHGRLMDEEAASVDVSVEDPNPEEIEGDVKMEYNGFEIEPWE